LIERRWHSSVFDVPCFKGAEYDTDHSLVVVNVREIMALSKLATQKFAVERFNLRELDDLKVRNSNRLTL